MEMREACIKWSAVLRRDRNLLVFRRIWSLPLRVHGEFTEGLFLKHIFEKW